MNFSTRSLAAVLRLRRAKKYHDKISLEALQKLQDIINGRRALFDFNGGGEFA